MAYDPGLTNLIATQPIRMQELQNQTAATNASVANTQQQTQQNQMMQPYKVQAAKQDLETGKFEKAKKGLDLLSALVYGVVDQPSYEAAMQQYKGMGGDVSQFGPTYNPEQINQVKMGLATATARLNAMVSMSHQRQVAADQMGAAPGAYGWTGGLDTGSSMMNPTVPQAPPPSVTPDYTPMQPSPVTASPLAPNPPPAADIPSPAADMGLPPASGPALNAPPMQMAGMDPRMMGIINNPQKNISGRKMDIDALKSSPEYAAELKGSEAEAVQQAEINAAAAKKQEADIGEQRAATSQKATAAKQTYQRILENLDAMDKLVDDMPEDKHGATSAQRAYLSQHFGGVPLIGDSQKAANAYKQWQQINHAGILNGLQQLMQGGNLKSNMTIDAMVSDQAGIDPGASKPVKHAMIQNLKKELENNFISTENISAAVNGGEQKPYQAIDPLTTQNAVHYKDYFK